MADDLDRASSAPGHGRLILEQSSDRRESRPPARGISPIRSQAANALSAFRFVAAAAWIALAARGVGGAAEFGTLAAAAAASDFVDGRLARRLDAVTVAGRWLDSLADIAFVLAALGSEAARGAISFYIPVLIALSFTQYAVDSLMFEKSGAGPVRSRLGHWGGIINYALVFALGVAPPDSMVAGAIRDLAPVLALFYLAAIAERALSYRNRAVRWWSEPGR